jgi:hypothetical protein
MNNIQIKILECIKNAHSFSKTLEGTETISREYLVNNLTEFSSTEIHVKLIDLKEKGEIEYDSEKGLISIFKI